MKERSIVMRDRLWLGSVVLVGSILLTLACTIIVARSLGLSTAEPTHRMRFHALPVAISQIYYNFPHDFTANWQIAMAFQGSSEKSTQQLIKEAVANPPPVGGQIYYWTADDRGLADFAISAFRVFGPSIPSLFYFWFLLVGASVAVAIVAYWRDPWGLAVVACATIAIGFSVPIYTRAVCDMPIHISESRMFDVLGGVAFVHLLLSIFRQPRGPFWITVSALMAQACLLGFLLHARSTLIWLFLAIIVTSLTVAVARFARQGLVRGSLQGLMPAALIICTWVGVLGYQHVMFNSAYRTEIGARTVWHNVLMGFYVSPVFANKLAFTGIQDGQADDAQAVEAVLRDMKSRGSPRLTENWTRDNILNSLGGHSRFDWVGYEKQARSLVFSTLRADPGAALAMFLWYKPKATLQSFLCATLRIGACGTNSTRRVGVPDAECPQKNTTPFSIYLFMMAIASGVGLGFATNGGMSGRVPQAAELGPIALSALFAISLSLLLSYLFYPAPTQLGGTSFLVATVVYAAIAWFVGRLINATLQIRDRRIYGQAS